MSRETQADVFIKTLAEMLEDERERRSLRLQRQFEAHVERFQHPLRNGFDGNLRPPASAQQYQPVAREIVGRATNG